MQGSKVWDIYGLVNEIRIEGKHVHQKKKNV